MILPNIFNLDGGNLEVNVPTTCSYDAEVNALHEPIRYNVSIVMTSG